MSSTDGLAMSFFPHVPAGSTLASTGELEDELRARLDAGRARLARGEIAEAKRALEASLEDYDLLGKREGFVGGWMPDAPQAARDLARVLVRSGEKERARAAGDDAGGPAEGGRREPPSGPPALHPGERARRPRGAGRAQVV